MTVQGHSYDDNIGAPAFRNLIINGCMNVAQRGTSVASITTSGYYTADRFATAVATIGTWTQSIENDAPTGSGLRKSLKILCTTADASPAAGDAFRFRQYIEGQNVQHIAKGTVSAKQLTLSFWVKSNKIGTYIVELTDNDNSRFVSAAYSILVSGVWEKKTITFPADSTGVFDNDAELSLMTSFWLGAGSNATSGTLGTVWASIVEANRAVGQVNLAAATSNYWQVTGIQLEVGSVATPFEFEPFETTLRKCQRYFTRYTDAGSGNFPQSLAHTDLAGRPEITIQYTEKRSDAVAITFSSAAAISVTNMMTGTAYNSTSLNFYAGYNRFCSNLFIDTGTAAPVNVPYLAQLRTSAYMDISAEL